MKLFRGQPDHDHWRRPFTPTEKANAWAGVGALLLIMGGTRWLTPDVPPFTGKWSALHSSLYEAFGPRGIPLAMFLAGALFIAAAISTWLRERRKGVPNGMKTFHEIEADVTALGELIGASKHDLPTYGASRDSGYAHVEVENGLYHYVVVERGQELERRSSATYGDLLYWIFESATHSLAFAYELGNRVEDQDCRRIAFPKQIELMKKLSSEMGARLEMKIADILSRAPYDDEPTEAANRLRKHNAS
jgi:hypothetical protein